MTKLDYITKYIERAVTRPYTQIAMGSINGEESDPANHAVKYINDEQVS